MRDANYSGLDTVIIVSRHVIFIIYYVTILFRVYICNRKNYSIMYSVVRSTKIDIKGVKI